MSMRFALLAVVALTACTQGGDTGADGLIGDAVALTPVFEKPEGYPYPLGNLTGTIGGTAYTLKSYDYSVGAIDPSAWVHEMDGTRKMRITFESADDPEADGPALVLQGNPPGPLAKGMRLPVTVDLVQEQEKADLTLLQTKAPADMVVTDFTEGGSGSYDRIGGTVSGTLCAPAGTGCVPMTLRFDTGIYQNDW